MLKNQQFLQIVVALLVVVSCRNQGKKGADIGTMDKEIAFKEGSFGHDTDFLKKWDSDLILLKSGNAAVAVSGKYQAKVFTSSVSGDEGRSMGWINYGAFGKMDPHMNAYGGESRFWLGPEGSAFSLFFKPQAEMTFENWKTPPPIDSEGWDVTKKSGTSVVLERTMEIENYAGHTLHIQAQREIKILTIDQLEELLGVRTRAVKSVGYKTKNTITNIGNFEWTETTGAPCIWILDMFPPSEETTIMIPYKQDSSGPIATTDYFGEIPEERIGYEEGILFFKADGKSRGKLGIPPQRATPLAGSYDAQNNVLTIALFDVDSKATYLNQEWNLEGDPLIGDAVNAYNDGPLEDGSQMGPFYELESVSPAAFLKPNESLTHNHSVFHLTGKRENLEQIVAEVFGTTLDKITNFL
ncbi:DUF6786 family protein [Flagellimonas iocasae]|uniref:DUF6786 family protein n=1 Tax=Flagellimonas iocasae TaxID=2055905 RepID=A0ABW4Y1U1_9FLAO